MQRLSLDDLWNLEGSMIKDAFERLLFACRFLLAPLYLALAISLVALLYKSGMHLYQMLTQLPDMSDEEILLSDLAIVDLTLTASLVVIVFLSGYANFVTPVAVRENDGRPHWIGEIDFSELKLKLMASIVAISAIKLLEGFMNIDHESDRQLYWLVGIHVTFVISTLILALADRFGHHSRRIGGDPEGV
ncbi:MAG TPA: TIGR00645 family protein [Roseiarcus sp.]